MTLIFTSNVAGGNLQLKAPRATPPPRGGVRVGVALALWPRGYPGFLFLAFPSTSRVYHTRDTPF